MSTDGRHRGVGWCAWAEISEATSLLKLADFGEASRVPLGTERAVLASMEPDRRQVPEAPLAGSEKGRWLLPSPAAWHWVVAEEKSGGRAPCLLGRGTNQASSQGLGLWGSGRPIASAPPGDLPPPPLTPLLALPELLWHMPGPSGFSAASGNKRPGQWELPGKDSPEQPPKVSVGSWSLSVGCLPPHLGD